MQALRFVLLAASLLAVACGAGAPSEATGWKLSHHSFERTLTYDDGLADWLSSAATMALRDRVQVMPPVADRYGLFWSKRSMRTDNFKISARLRVDVPAAGASTDGGFVFWLSPDNFSATYNEEAIVTTSKNWATGLEKAGLTFLSNRPSFKGLAVVFTDADGSGKKRPTVTCIYSDGSKTESLTSVLARADSAGNKAAANWEDKGVVLSVRVMPDGSIAVSVVKELPEADATPTKLFEGSFPIATVPHTQTESFFGFSGWSGSSGKKTQLSVDVDRIVTTNFDQSKVGEQELSNDLMFDDGGEWLKVLEGERRFINQVAQKEAVARLTKLLSNHMEKYISIGGKLKEQLGTLDARCDLLSSDMGLLSTELQAYDPETHTVNAQAVKDHLKGLRSILSKPSGGAHDPLDKVNKVARDLKENGVNLLGVTGKEKLEDATKQSVLLEKQAAEGASNTNVLLCILIVVVAGLGCLFLNRMRYYEKKHYI